MTLTLLLIILIVAIFLTALLSDMPWPMKLGILTFYVLSIFGVVAYAQDSSPPASPPREHSTPLFPTYYEEAGRGRHWYQAPPPPEEEPETRPDPTPSPVPAPLTPREILKQQGEQWEDALALAVLHPSAENYLEYLRLTAAIQAQAQQFATGFREAIWSAPEYDYTLVNPVRAEAISAKNQAALQQETADLTALADRYGLVFFLRERLRFNDGKFDIATRFRGILFQKIPYPVGVIHQLREVGHGLAGHVKIQAYRFVQAGDDVDGARRQREQLVLGQVEPDSGKQVVADGNQRHRKDRRQQDARAG